MINFTPNPIAFSLGPLEVHWYGIAYVVAIIAAYYVVVREGRRRGLDTTLVADGLIVVAVAALIGGRAYHVIDQWQLYKDDLAKIVLPPYTGLGVYGGLATGALTLLVYARWKRQPFWRWGDVIVLGVLAAQVLGRWGNFFNQELYGPPTNLPWGISIDCAHRVAAYLCPANGGTVAADAHFHPLFLYESLLSLLGLIVLTWVLHRFVGRGRPLMTGDVGMLYFVWYGVERAILETFRTTYDWTFFGIPTAQLVGLGAAAIALAVIVVRHRFFRHPETEDGPAAAGATPGSAETSGEPTPETLNAATGDANAETAVGTKMTPDATVEREPEVVASTSPRPAGRREDERQD